MKTKTIITICLVTVMAMVFATTAFAQNPGSGQEWGANQTFRNEFQQKAALAAQNRAEVQSLLGQIRQEGQLLRQKIQALRDNPGSLSPEELAEIREGIRLINSGRRELGQTLGSVIRQSLQMRENRLNGNFNGCMENMDNILAIQEARINTLNKLLNDIQNLNNQL